MKIKHQINQSKNKLKSLQIYKFFIVTTKTLNCLSATTTTEYSIPELKVLLEQDVCAFLNFEDPIRISEGCSSELLMAVIISKVTNIVNTEHNLLIPQNNCGAELGLL